MNRFALLAFTSGLLAVQSIQAAQVVAEKEENSVGTGFGGLTGLMVGAAAGGPIGAVVGAAIGGWSGAQVQSASGKPALPTSCATTKARNAGFVRPSSALSPASRSSCARGDCESLELCSRR